VLSKGTRKSVIRVLITGGGVILLLYTGAIGPRLRHQNIPTYTCDFSIPVAGPGAPGLSTYYFAHEREIVKLILPP
jgi:hypothetical protein